MVRTELLQPSAQDLYEVPGRARHPDTLKIYRQKSLPVLLSFPLGVGGGLLTTVRLFAGKMDFFKILINLAALGLSCGMWHLVSQPGIELGPSALKAWSFSHWTTGEVPAEMFKPW
ncbi:unnamed protein product [Rangifer tarandus platyrhynchus]|uniref:Uncharacterized protein n=1 Tax=Rangifer tarandus platyrhynchus TaxID=3082113 RepID=A0ABN9A5T8_RANTA|nr:unnamed protein product [Rangifer tarandus platyrhynchus]